MHHFILGLGKRVKWSTQNHWINIKEPQLICYERICYIEKQNLYMSAVHGFNKTLATPHTENITDILGGNSVWIAVSYVITLELNHVRSSLKSLIAIHVIGFC